MEKRFRAPLSLDPTTIWTVARPGTIGMYDLRPRSSDRPLYAFITSAIGERPQYNLLKINILNFSGILPYALISH